MAFSCAFVLEASKRACTGICLEDTNLLFWEVLVAVKDRRSLTDCRDEERASCSTCTIADKIDENNCCEFTAALKLTLTTPAKHAQTLTKGLVCSGRRHVTLCERGALEFVQIGQEVKVAMSG